MRGQNILHQQLWTNAFVLCLLTIRLWIWGGSEHNHNLSIFSKQVSSKTFYRGRYRGDKDAELVFEKNIFDFVCRYHNFGSLNVRKEGHVKGEV